MSAEMQKMPDPVGEAFYDHVHKNGLIERRKTHIFTAEQMREYAQEAARQAMERCAEVCDDQEEPAWYGYENPNSFDDGKRACAKAIRALIPQSEKRHG